MNRYLVHVLGFFSYLNVAAKTFCSCFCLYLCCLKFFHCEYVLQTLEETKVVKCIVTKNIAGQ